MHQPEQARGFGRAERRGELRGEFRHVPRMVFQRLPLFLRTAFYAMSITDHLFFLFQRYPCLSSSRPSVRPCRNSARPRNDPAPNAETALTTYSNYSKIHSSRSMMMCDFPGARRPGECDPACNAPVPGRENATSAISMPHRRQCCTYATGSGIYSVRRSPEETFPLISQRGTSILKPDVRSGPPSPSSPSPRQVPSPRRARWRFPIRCQTHSSGAPSVRLPAQTQSPRSP